MSKSTQRSKQQKGVGGITALAARGEAVFVPGFQLSRVLEAIPLAFPELPDWHFWTWMALERTGSPPPGWQLITSVDDTLLALCSHLSSVHLIRAEKQVSSIYARPIDIQEALRNPAILVVRVPAVTPLQRPETSQTIGTHAILFGGATVYLYDLDQLGQEGKTCWQHLHQVIADILQSDASHVDQFLLSEAQATAKALSTLYWRFHQRQVTPSHARALPPVPNVLGHGGGVLIPASQVVDSVLVAYSNAQSGGKGWKPVEEVPTYVHEQSNTVTAVQLRPQNLPVTEVDIPRQLWQKLQQFSDLDGDVLLAMLAQASATPADEKGGVWITGQQILEYRGIKPKQHRAKGAQETFRPAGHRPEDLAMIAASVSRIRDTHVTVRQWTGKTRRKRIFHQSYLVTIADFILQAPLIPSGIESTSQPATLELTPLEVAWYFRLGSCLEMFSTGPHRQLAWLLQQTLGYDPYHEQWEKRLARYFTFHLRINPAFGGILRRSIGDLIGELSLPVNRKDPERTKVRFEKAMQTLVSDGQISDWGPQSRYDDAMRTRPAHGWLETWLAFEVEVSALPLTSFPLPNPRESLRP